MKGEHFAATTEPKRVAELLRAMDGYGGTLAVRCALRLAPLVFVRPGSYAGPNGQTLILRRQNGATP